MPRYIIKIFVFRFTLYFKKLNNRIDPINPMLIEDFIIIY